MALARSRRSPKETVFTASGSFSVPIDVGYVWVTMVASGSSGAGGRTSTGGGGGGGGGSTANNGGAGLQGVAYIQWFA